MFNKILATPIDDMVKLIQNNTNCTISFLQSKMNLPLEVIEKWLTVLEEYKVIEIHYQGLKGFVKYVEKDKLNSKTSNSIIDVNKLKEQFIEKAQTKNITNDKLNMLWLKFVEFHEAEIKEQFEEVALKKGINKKMTYIAWEKYREELIKF